LLAARRTQVTRTSSRRLFQYTWLSASNCWRGLLRREKINQTINTKQK
jgi:hypothetical protein